MDPLTAFSLAASVVQFVTFAGGLLKKSVEIHDSVSGLPKALDIEEAYRDLKGFSSSLHDLTDASVSTVDTQIRKDVASLKALASTCKSDCDALLDVIDKLRINDGRSRRIKSIRASFTAFRKEGEIKHLEKRLAETGSQITLYLCRISNFYHISHTRALNNLKEQAVALAVNQHARLDSLASSLAQVKTIITTQFQKHELSRPELPRVDEIRDVRELMAKLALSELDMSREQKLLHSLQYEHHLDRYQSITPAHKKTFSWVFNPANTSSKGKRLVQWLRHGQGVFWVTGKPGSGKSTMMKFLCDDVQTALALQEWACDKDLAIVSHYFWLSGTSLQKSQEGLFRSLLHGIFQRCPELIRKVCPTLWYAASVKHNGIESHHWTLDELLGVISSISSLSGFAVKFCIFIDGLDEYHGDHMEMCKTLQTLGTASQDIKLCVSSRPWNDFENAFGGGERLIEMQNLTRDDIREYTHSRLSEHWAWTTIAANTCLADSLINLILRHAEGVFLWVVLVTKELRDSLSNYDSLEDLYRRVEGFPSDLGDFFRHILESVDSFYHAKMSTVLQIALAAGEPLRLPIYHFHEHEFTDSDYALTLPILQPTEQAAVKRFHTIEKRLNGWCKGLLEVHQGLEVHFLHRTVRDFLQTEQMATILKAKAPAGFSANLSIMKAYTAWIKSHTFYDRPRRASHASDYGPSQFVAPFTWMTSRFLAAASVIEDLQDHVSGQVQVDAIRHIKEFERSVIELEDRGQISLQSNEAKYAKYAADLFRSDVVSWGLSFYLSSKLTEDPCYLTVTEHILFIEACTNRQRPDSCCDKLRKFIEHALEVEDPNEEIDLDGCYSTAFSNVMSCMNDNTGGIYRGRHFIRMRLISLFLKFGANPNASVNVEGWDPCRLMIAMPLVTPGGAYDGDAYLSELKSLFEYGANSEMKAPRHGESGGGLSGPSNSAREWFFDELQKPLDKNLNKSVIGQVALRLLQRVEDSEGADAAWGILESSLPYDICQGIKTAATGTKRKRTEERQQALKRPKRCAERYRG